jgi:quercetin dioxygenase-like cupin family protein
MIESSSVAFKRSPSAETTLDVFGVDVTFLVENAHTGGRFGMVEYVSKPGHEPPPHWHEHEDEAFYIVEGYLEMHVGDQVFRWPQESASSYRSESRTVSSSDRRVCARFV